MTAAGGDTLPFVSIIIPCRNEKAFIALCLDSLLATTYPIDRLEIIVADGMSDDGTRDVLERYPASRTQIRVLDNPRRTTPAALNVAILAARGDVIMRVDAHSVYPTSYVPQLVDWLQRTGADNVGGLAITEPGGTSAIARAIAIALSHPAGVGNAHFRIGTTEPRWVDTVPFGCYRRDVFDRVGLFDEDLIRNQDDEFNVRLLGAGGRILLVPDVVCHYVARNSLGKLWVMYEQYGYFKPLVIRKNSTVVTWRQLIPPLFVLAVVASFILPLFSTRLWLASGFIVGSYLLFLLVVAATQIRRQGVRVALACCLALPTLHFSYGLGYLRGLVDFLLLRRDSARGAPSAVRLSR
jgi:glycosyltransferase involved in cell wall biosynthesis